MEKFYIEIMTHILTIEKILSESYGIKKWKINECIDEMREYVKECLKEEEI